MNPAIDLQNAKVFFGSCLDVLPTLADNSVDAIVTDPPYELGFMGKSWDNSGIAYNVDVWRECLRVLKPGGHILAFGGSRTWHRLAVAIEDAGFEMRDSIAWLYGSGFPKSHNVGNAIDKKLGMGNRGHAISSGSQIHPTTGKARPNGELLPKYEGRTPEGKKWDGWGTALKPAHEPIVVARKPVEGTVANNVLTYGTGALNIDGTRVGTETITINTFDNGAKPFGDAIGEPYTSKESQGRWPANIILDEYTAELLDEQSGLVKGAVGMKKHTGYTFDVGYHEGQRFTQGKPDIGGASRFFYVAKANKKDRNEGEVVNTHPTVKPTALMQYLVRLVTPENGIVLDPFTGSGSTGKAAILENKQFIGIELTEEYLPIIAGRLEHAINTSEKEEGDDLFASL